MGSVGTPKGQSAEEKREAHLARQAEAKARFRNESLRRHLALPIEERLRRALEVERREGLHGRSIAFVHSPLGLMAEPTIPLSGTHL